MLQLDEAGTDGRDVALLIGKRHPSSSLRVLQLWVGVNASIADAPIQPVHDHRQLHCGGKGGLSVYTLAEVDPP